MTDRDFWLAIRRAAKVMLAALNGRGTASTQDAAKDALSQVIAAIERRWPPQQ